jgi:hypothetical protein
MARSAMLTTWHPARLPEVPRRPLPQLDYARLKRRSAPGDYKKNPDFFVAREAFLPRMTRL